jgi:YD repeat-containing protein
MVTGAGTTQYAYDAADRLTLVDPPGAGSTSYTFDDNGNLTSRGSDSFSWDAEDRLTSATVSSVTTTFTYNGDGLRDSHEAVLVSTRTGRIINFYLPDDGVDWWVRNTGLIPNSGYYP